MKHFVYLYTRRTNDRNGNPRHTAKVYRVTRGMLHFLGTEDIGYRSESQAVCDFLRAGKHISRTKAAEIFDAWTLEHRGIATLQAITADV